MWGPAVLWWGISRSSYIARLAHAKRMSRDAITLHGNNVIHIMALSESPQVSPILSPHPRPPCSRFTADVSA